MMLKPEAIASGSIRDVLRSSIDDHRLSVTELNDLIDEAGERVIKDLRGAGYEVKGVYRDRED